MLLIMVVELLLALVLLLAGGGAALREAKLDPPTRPPDLAAKASSGIMAPAIRAAATAPAKGKANLAKGLDEVEGSEVARHEKVLTTRTADEREAELFSFRGAKPPFRVENWVVAAAANILTERFGKRVVGVVGWGGGDFQPRKSCCNHATQ